MRVLLQYFDGCPSWQVTQTRLLEALTATGHSDVPIDLQRVETLEAAVASGFIGSPTVRIDGEDPFADATAQPRLACRMFATPDGLQGSPTVEQLIDALGR